MDDCSKEWWRELDAYQYKSCKIDSRCCRQVKLGSISVNPKEDPILLDTPYKLCINFCPECGRPLDNV